MSEFSENEWNLIKIKNVEKSYLMKIILKEDSVTCFLCDMIALKSETLSKKEIISRAKKRNPGKDPGEQKTLDYVCKTKAFEYWFDEEDGNRLHLKYFIGQLSYYFTWNLQPANQEDFMKFFTAPLFCSLKSSQERMEELHELLRKKDDEIEGYKMSGATLIRKNLETLPFDPKDFSNSHEFSFVHNHSIQDIYKLCGVKEVPQSVLSVENSVDPSKKSSSTSTAPNSTKTSPSTGPRKRPSRMLMQIMNKQKDEKVLYDEYNSSQEFSFSPDEEKDVEVDGNLKEKEVPDPRVSPPPPKIVKPSRKLKL